MVRSILLRLLVCTALLFGQGFSQEAAEPNPSPSEIYNISGTYINLNTSSVTHSNLTKCPHNVSIGGNGLQVGVATPFAFDLAHLNISSELCTYTTEQPQIIEVRNHTVQMQMRNFTTLNMTLPANVLKCSSESSVTGFPGGDFFFVPSMRQMQESSVDSEELPEEKQEKTKSGERTIYTLIFENVTKGQMCTFFPEVHYKEIKEHIEDKFPGYPPWFDPYDTDYSMYLPQGDEDQEDMNIGKGKSLKFCPICNCQAKLGTDLDLESIEMSEDESTEMSQEHAQEKPTPEVGADEGWRPPKILVGRKRCPVSISKKLEDVVGENESSEEMHDESYKETKELVLRAVVDKIYDEIKLEYKEEWNNMTFDMRREMVTAFMMMKSFHHRRVMVMRRGARCGKERKSIDQDTVLLYEKKHILSQLNHDPFVMNNSVKAGEIRKLESMTEYSFTLHVYRKDKDKRLSACTFSNSRRSCDLLSSQEFCKNFKPLGVMSAYGYLNGTGGDSGDRKPGGKNTAESSPEVSPEREDPPGNESPTPTASPGTSSTNAFCFPAEAKVERMDGRKIRMDELRVGEYIRDGDGEFSKVILLTHANKDVVSEFIRLETSSGDIVLSGQHYIPVNGKVMTAESVKEGDVIYVLKWDRKMEAIVTKVERVLMAGLFNPQTISGSLAVWMNGHAVVASAYTAGIDPNIAHTLLAPLRMLNHWAGVVVPWSWLFKNGNDHLVRMFPSGRSVIM